MRKLVLLFLFAIITGVSAVRVTAQGDPEAGTVVEDRFGVEMVYVPAGTVQMGVSLKEASRICIGDVPQKTLAGWSDEEAEAYVELCLAEQRDQSIFFPYEAKVDGFWIDKYEFSFSQTHICPRCICPTCFDVPEDIDPMMPVTGIDWLTAVRFCTLREARLPSEQEWEYAASGPDNLSLVWGGSDISEYVEPVGSPKPLDFYEWDVSWIGVHGMLWNVNEWVDARSLPYPDFDGEWFENVDASRVIRGGTWAGTILDATTYSRFHSYAGSSSDNYANASGATGFRCARTPSHHYPIPGKNGDQKVQ